MVLFRRWLSFRGWSKILGKFIVGLLGQGDSGRSLLTGGRCSEEVVSTGLTVLGRYEIVIPDVKVKLVEAAQQYHYGTQKN